MGVGGAKNYFHSTYSNFKIRCNMIYLALYTMHVVLALYNYATCYTLRGSTCIRYASVQKECKRINEKLNEYINV